MVLCYQDGDGTGAKVGDEITKNWSITTEPGDRHMDKSANKAHMKNSLGTVMMMPGQYKYKKGKHGSSPNRHVAFRQYSGIWAQRDNNMDGYYDYDTAKKYWVAGDDEKCENGKKKCSPNGVNIHRSAGMGTTKRINGYSAGCQVFANGGDLSSLISIYDKINSIPKDAADDMKYITYTLLLSTDVQKYESAGTTPDSQGRIGTSR